MREREVEDEELLLIPGPVTVTEHVLSTMGAPVRAHYGDDWVELYRHVTDLAVDVELCHAILSPGSLRSLCRKKRPPIGAETKSLAQGHGVAYGCAGLRGSHGPRRPANPSSITGTTSSATTME